MTVLMNLPREPTGNYKYTQSYEAVTRFIRAFCRENALESLQRFYAYFVLCVAVRNGDAHLKNFELLYEHAAAAASRLSPLYDVVTTAAYDDINVRTGQMQTDRTLALKLNKSTGYPNSDWQRVEFGKTFCLVRSPEKAIDRICEADDAVSATGTAWRHVFRRLQDECDRHSESISATRVTV